MMQLKPSEIRYCQNSISCVFTGKHHGTKIGKTLDGLMDGDISVNTIPCISVTIKNGNWFTHDNRRLWVLKHFELLGGCAKVSVIQKGCLEMRKFTTYNDGTDIRVRGDPGGIWYNKYTRNPEKYKNFLRHENISAHNESSAPTITSIVSDEVSRKVLFGDLIVDTIKIEPVLEQVTNTVHNTLKRKRCTANKTRTYSRKKKSWSAYFSFSSTPLSKMPAKPDLRQVFPSLMSQLNPISNATCTYTPSTSSALSTASSAKIVSFSKLIVQYNTDMLQSVLYLSKQEPEMKTLTRYNEGTDNIVRGDRGGIWYNKYTRNPEKYKNCLRIKNVSAHNESSAPSYVSFSSNPSLSKMPAKPDLRQVFPCLMSQLNPISNAICTYTPSTSSALSTASAAKIVC
ncbi:hypothetical protein CHS0354_028503 [Potamilus streckersoni]|uniref:Uncharacterized protein n=1 Tax=Potamilus streckersoni TaxID=2493646 RepID=A0AAE0SFA7_9BIVA|nr:hypothetical protein CHS0354_028503 [Potamilus streckersoni]